MKHVPPRFADFRKQIFIPDVRAAKGRCFLDGADVTNDFVVYASEEDGKIICQALNDTGQRYIDPETEAVALLPPRFGVVEIYFDDEEVPAA